MTGSGTNWTTANGVIAGDFVQVNATHGGTAFTFMAQISSVTSTSGVTLSRPFPSDADIASGLTYYIMPASRTVVLHYKNQYTDPTYDPIGDSMLMFGTTGCESETAVYINPLSFGLGNSFAGGHDITVLDGQHFTGVQYSITDTTGWVNQSGTGGINFYGEDLAHWALYFRSGLNIAKSAAQAISNYWLHSPWANPDGNGYPRLFLGGGGVGAFTSKLLDPSSLVSWSNLRGYAAMGVAMANGVSTYGCNAYDDTRDSGWAYAWLILAAIYDPDTTSTSAPGGIPWRTYWQNALPTMQANDTNCERADHSWANGFYFNNLGPQISLTNNSTAGTGTNIATAACAGLATGGGSIGAESSMLTISSGSLPATNGGNTLVITGTMGGQPFTGSYLYSYSGGSTATLAVLWPGDSGSVTWMATATNANANNALTVFATSNNDLTDLQQNYACMWNSSTSITLDHPWAGATGTYYLYTANLAGYGQQPFMLGIKTLGMNFLATQTLPQLSSYATAYTQFAKDAAGWLKSTGADPNALGMNYGSVFAFCEPLPTPSAPGFIAADVPGCTSGFSIAARELNAEAASGISLYYQYNQSAANMTWADQMYGALWGSSTYNAGGVYQDANSVANNLGASNLLDAYIHAGKWTGFFAGAGMSHRWPAERIGRQSPVPRVVQIAYPANAIANATSARILLTAPTGASTTVSCTSSPCQVTVDDTQGTFLYQIQYLGTSAQILSKGDVALLH